MLEDAQQMQQLVCTLSALGSIKEDGALPHSGFSSSLGLALLLPALTAFRVIRRVSGHLL